MSTPNFNVGGTLEGAVIDSATNSVSANFLATTGAAVDIGSAAPPIAGNALIATSATAATWQAMGDVVGPASATDNAIVRFNLTTGKLVQDSVVTVADTTGVINIGNASGNIQVNGADVFPTSVTANTVPKFSGTTGRAVVASGNTIDASNNLVLAANLDLPATSASAGVIRIDGNRAFHLGGAGNVFAGNNAGTLAPTGQRNVGIGSFTLTALTTGSYNTACGSDIAVGLTIGEYNTLVGDHAGNSLTGSNNTLIGQGSGSNLDSGAGNIIIGTGSSGSAYTTSESNNIILGTMSGTIGESGVMRIGVPGTQTKAFVSGIRGVTTDVVDAIAVLIDSAGQLGTVSSSIKYKENVTNLSDPTNILQQLRPVEFNYIGKEKISIGLIAEEVAKIYPEMVVYQDGEIYTVDYARLPILLLAEMQKMRKDIDMLKSQLAQMNSVNK